MKARLIALFIDFFVIVLYALCLLGLTLALYHFLFGGIPDVLNTLGVNGAHLLGFLTLTLPAGLYFFFSETSHYHGSIGKRIVKIKVTTENGGYPPKKRIALRTAVKLLPWEFAHTFIYWVVYYSSNDISTPLWVMIGLYAANILPWVYVLIVFVRKDHRGPHDLIAKTLVTK